MIALILLTWLWASPLYAAEFAVTQSAAPTADTGTQDFTSTGFGTPLCALYWGGYGTANGTVVNHSGMWIGAYDGTRQYSMGQASEDNVSPTDTGSVIDSDSALITLLETSQAKNGEATASWITNGSRLTWADAPPAAYLINALLVGGSGVSNCYVGQATGNATLNGTTVVSAPGFEPDVLIVWSNNNLGTHQRTSIGMSKNNAGAIVQRAFGYNDTDASATSGVASILETDRIVTTALASSATLEQTSWDANGFTVTTRDVGAARPFTYMAIKLSGLNSFLHTSPAPTAIGNQVVTGVGFTPQLGIMLQGEVDTVDVVKSSSDGELFGFSVFTALNSGSSSMWNDDNVGTSNTESVTDTKVCRTREAAVDYATCTLVSFDSDGATYNYTATNGTARQRAVLYIQASSVPSGNNKRVMQRRNQE